MHVFTRETIKTFYKPYLLYDAQFPRQDDNASSLKRRYSDAKLRKKLFATTGIRTHDRKTIIGKKYWKCVKKKEQRQKKPRFAETKKSLDVVLAGASIKTDLDQRKKQKMETSTCCFYFVSCLLSFSVEELFFSMKFRELLERLTVLGWTA